MSAWSARGASFGAVNPPSQWLSPDLSQGLPLLRQACARAGCNVFRLGSEPAAATNYAIGERDDAAYVLLSRLREDGLPLWGDVGLRLARTAQDSRGLQVQADGTLKPVRAQRSYVDVLPSANLVWEPSDALTVRMGAARVMVRPDLRSLRPGFTVSTPSLKSVSAGDPYLTPTRATTLDLGVEWYAPNGAAVTVSTYHKAIASVIQQTISQPAPFSSNPYGLPDSVAALACGSAPGCDPDLPIWQFLRPANTGKGRLAGLEISASTALGDGSSRLALWRLQSSMAYTRSKVLYRMPSGAMESIQDALGGPRLVGNLALIYDGRRLNARASVNHRGRYLATAPALTGGDAEGVSALTSVDLSLRYAVSPQLTLAADLANLTDAVARQFIDRSRIPNYQHRTGRDFRLGLRYRYR